MRNDKLEIWWASLTIAQKERIDEEMVRYPACSRWWNSLDEESRQKIHDHCVDRHGYLLQEWNEADPYGD